MACTLLDLPTCVASRCFHPVNGLQSTPRGAKRAASTEKLTDSGSFRFAIFLLIAMTGLTSCGGPAVSFHSRGGGGGGGGVPGAPCNPPSPITNSGNVSLGVGTTT